MPASAGGPAWCRRALGILRRDEEPPTPWWPHVEDQMHASRGAWIVRPVSRLVVEGPQLSGAHHDRLPRAGERTPLRARQDQMKTITYSVVVTRVYVGINPAVRLKGHQGRAAKRPTEQGGDTLAPCQGARKLSGRGRGTTLMNIVGVPHARWERLLRRAEKDVAGVALAADLALAARVQRPRVRRRIQLGQEGFDFKVRGQSDEVRSESVCCLPSGTDIRADRRRRSFVLLSIGDHGSAPYFLLHPS